jgi:hypothetical protein
MPNSLGWVKSDILGLGARICGMWGKLSKAYISGSFDHFVPIVLLLLLCVQYYALMLEIAFLIKNLPNLLASC